MTELQQTQFKQSMDQHMIRLLPRSCFSSAQKKFVRTIFNMNLSDFASSDWNMYKNIHGNILCTCLKEEYVRLVEKYDIFSNLSKCSFRPLKKGLLISDETQQRMKTKLAEYYNKVIIPVLNKQGDFTNIRNYQLREISLKELN